MMPTPPHHHHLPASSTAASSLTAFFGRPRPFVGAIFSFSYLANWVCGKREGIIREKKIFLMSGGFQQKCDASCQCPMAFMSAYRFPALFHMHPLFSGKKRDPIETFNPKSTLWARQTTFRPQNGQVLSKNACTAIIGISTSRTSIVGLFHNFPLKIPLFHCAHLPIDKIWMQRQFFCRVFLAFCDKKKLRKIRTSLINELDNTRASGFMRRVSVTVRWRRIRPLRARATAGWGFQFAWAPALRATVEFELARPRDRIYQPFRARFFSSLFLIDFFISFLIKNWMQEVWPMK